jgi:hypothetical protein
MDIEQPDHPMPPITLLKTSTVIEIWCVTERDGHRLTAQRMLNSRASAIEFAYGLATKYLGELYHPNYRSYRIICENHGGRLELGLELLSHEALRRHPRQEDWTRPAYACDIMQYLLPAEDFTPFPELHHTPAILSPLGFQLQPGAAR